MRDDAVLRLKRQSLGKLPVLTARKLGLQVAVLVAQRLDLILHDKSASGLALGMNGLTGGATLGLDEPLRLAAAVLLRGHDGEGVVLGLKLALIAGGEHSGFSAALGERLGRTNALNGGVHGAETGTLLGEVVGALEELVATNGTDVGTKPGHRIHDHVIATAAVAVTTAITAPTVTKPRTHKTSHEGARCGTAPANVIVTVHIERRHQTFHNNSSFCYRLMNIAYSCSPPRVNKLYGRQGTLSIADKT